MTHENYVCMESQYITPTHGANLSLMWRACCIGVIEVTQLFLEEISLYPDSSQPVYQGNVLQQSSFYRRIKREISTQAPRRAKDSSWHNSLYSTLSSHHLHTRQLIFTNQDDVLSEDHDPYGEPESLFKTTSLYHANYLHKTEERSSILTSI